MRRGFTLLEAIIVVTLLGLVGLSFGYLSSFSQRLMIQSMNSSTAQGEAAFALEHIKRHLTPATAIVTPATGSSGDVLEFTWRPRAVDADRTSRYEIVNEIVNGIVETNLQFDPDINNTIDPSLPDVIARRIRTIPGQPIFTRVTAGTISVNITARKTTGGDSRDMRLQTNISPRGLS